jgi:sugar/nucleoside kinase (ribokinase family)
VGTVVDATGAGDAFVAGFIAGILEGMDPFEAAEVANAVAASCVSAVGASTAIRALHQYL